MVSGGLAQTIGVRGGLNLATFRIEDDNDTYSDDFEMNPGFHVGVIANFPLAGIVSFEPGLLLSTKGYKYGYEEISDGETWKYEGKMNLMYVDIPLMAKANIDVGGAEVFGALGPYVGLGLTGKMKSETTIMGEKETNEEDISWGSDEEDDLKRLDYGLMAGVGAEFGPIQFGVSYAYGLANIATFDDDGFHTSNRVLSVSVGYLLGY